MNFFQEEIYYVSDYWNYKIILLLLSFNIVNYIFSFIIEVQLIYNITLISGVQHSYSVILALFLCAISLWHIYSRHSNWYFPSLYPYLAHSSVLIPNCDHQLVFYICELVSVLLYTQSCFSFQITHISDKIGYLPFCETSLSIMLSSSIHVVAKGRISFFFMAGNIQVLSFFFLDEHGWRLINFLLFQKKHLFH